MCLFQTKQGVRYDGIAIDAIRLTALIHNTYIAETSTPASKLYFKLMFVKKHNRSLPQHFMFSEIIPSPSFRREPICSNKSLPSFLADNTQNRPGDAV